MTSKPSSRTRRWGVLLAGFTLAAAACSSYGAGAASVAPGSAAPAAPTPVAASAAPSSATSGGGGRYGQGGDDEYGDGAASPAATPAASPAGSAGSGGEADAYEVKVANGAVGAFLTGEDGKTLYVFEKDSPNTSTCSGDCAGTWPPFIVDTGETVTAGDGVTGALTTFARADGTMQVAYDGAPALLLRRGLGRRRRRTGQGLGDVWFVAAP